MSHLVKALAVIVATLGAQASWAAATYNFSTAGSTTCGSFSTSCYGNMRTYSATESVTGAVIGVTAKAYSNTGAASSAGSNAGAVLQDAYLGTHGGSGLGIVNRDQASSAGDTNEVSPPEHSLDNNQRYDMMLLSFTKEVALSELSIGWTQYDSDLSVWAYKGAGAPVMTSTYANMLASTSSGLVAAGWVVVGNYANAGTGSENINGIGLTSSYWLVGAYNPGGTAASCGTATNSTVTDPSNGLDCGDDYVKLLSVSIADQSTPTTEVPEPGTLLLTGLALAGIAANRKRRK